MTTTEEKLRKLLTEDKKYKDTVNLTPRAWTMLD